MAQIEQGTHKRRVLYVSSDRGSCRFSEFSNFLGTHLIRSDYDAPATTARMMRMVRCFDQMKPD